VEADRSLDQTRTEHPMPTRRGPRDFDPVALGHRETDAWAAYYRHEWASFLAAAVAMVDIGFALGRRRTLVGAWHVLRANQLWAPFPDNDPDGARSSMRRFYALVDRAHDLGLDTTRAAELEVEWWRLHRARQHDPAVPESDLVGALMDLYAFVYDEPRDAMLAAARSRVQAMDLSDAWVRAGCRRDDPTLAAERRALVASYSALRAAVERV
jgi:hypothetical protein